MSHKLKKKKKIQNLKIKPDRVYMLLQVKFKKNSIVDCSIGLKSCFHRINLCVDFFQRTTSLPRFSPFSFNTGTPSEEEIKSKKKIENILKKQQSSVTVSLLLIIFTDCGLF